MGSLEELSAQISAGFAAITAKMTQQEEMIRDLEGNVSELREQSGPDVREALAERIAAQESELDVLRKRVSFRNITEADPPAPGARPGFEVPPDRRSSGRGHHVERRNALSILEILEANFFDRDSARDPGLLESFAPGEDARNSPEPGVEEPTPVRPELAAHRPASTVRVKVDTYDGSTPLEDYLLQFELIAKLQGWTVSEQAVMLASSLRGNALAILGEIPPAKRGNLADIIVGLRMRFGREYFRDLAHHNLRSRRQQPKEELGAYALDIQKLARHAFRDCPAEARDRIALCQFIDGLADLELQDLVRLTRPSTMEKALLCALDFDACRRANRAAHKVARSAVVETLELGLSRHDADAASPQPDTEAPRTRDGSPRSKKKFWRHRRTRPDYALQETAGQSASESRSEPTTDNAPPVASATGVSPTHTVVPALVDPGTLSQPDQTSPKPSLCRGSRLVHVEGVEMSCTGRGLVIEGSVNEIPCDIVVDTGATCVFVGRRIYDALNPKPELRPSLGTLVTVVGVASPVLGEAVVSLKFQGKEISSRVLMADVMDDCILGVDFLMQHAAAIDFKTLRLQVSVQPNGGFPSGETVVARSARLKTCSAIALRASSESLVGAFGHRLMAEGLLPRWNGGLASYDLRLMHRAGYSSGNTDDLSHHPCAAESSPHSDSVELRDTRSPEQVELAGVMTLNLEEQWDSPSCQESDQEICQVRRWVKNSVQPGGITLSAFKSGRNRYLKVFGSSLPNGVQRLAVLPQRMMGEVIAAKLDPHRGTRRGTSPVLMEEPLEYASTGCFGQLLVTPGGKRYALVLPECFTKCPEAAAVSVTRFLVDFGVMMILQCQSKLVPGVQEDWYVCFPLFILVYRSMGHRMAGFNPERMLMERELRLPVDLQSGQPPGGKAVEYRIRKYPCCRPRVIHADRMARHSGGKSAGTSEPKEGVVLCRPQEGRTSLSQNWEQ